MLCWSIYIISLCLKCPNLSSRVRGGGPAAGEVEELREARVLHPDDPLHHLLLLRLCRLHWPPVAARRLHNRRQRHPKPVPRRRYYYHHFGRSSNDDFQNLR